MALHWICQSTVLEVFTLLFMLYATIAITYCYRCHILNGLCLCHRILWSTYKWHPYGVNGSIDRLTVTTVRQIYIQLPYSHSWLECASHYTQGDSDVISMPAGFHHHLAGKKLRNNFYCDIAEICYVGRLVIIQTFSQTNGSNAI